jgi:fructose-1,6-bisphosphatase/inositol monophosphatase family enzyme
MTPQDATKLAAVEQMVATDNAARPKAGSSDTSSSGSDNTTWMTAADVSASAELAAELQAAMADKTWHPEGEGLLSVVSCVQHPMSKYEWLFGRQRPPP